jgi:hypothetical protein
VVSAYSVYYWSQKNVAMSDNGKIGISHFKYGVANGRRMFLLREDFTEYASTINIELAMLMTCGKLPGQLLPHFQQLVRVGNLTPV